MTQYQVKFHPILALVEAESEQEAQELALEMAYKGELEFEIDAITVELPSQVADNAPVWGV